MRITKEIPGGRADGGVPVRLLGMGVGVIGETGGEGVLLRFLDATDFEIVLVMPLEDAMTIAADLPGDAARAREIRRASNR